ncbi:hypothetical protein PUNSTDRAFT_101940 [Punctularia strigosozonata HHB-11173 SS5]|uniref:uncharacterized protein n=1 Tax=Punctularia strigosozonata (strain HHB-11173) TaxID=741275 RepID=UPI00044164CA|nr:uncharacterized protein PUNSTDRAFT_101940 [Punctularia strigosozonata HHB-11173 SS5]EIN09971.1 hypothetical protein PUNSTDRAFT_101940 [Punctularia strigosozonata HHB-11173 SS5]
MISAVDESPSTALNRLLAIVLAALSTHTVQAHQKYEAGDPTSERAIDDDVGTSAVISSHLVFFQTQDDTPAHYFNCSLPTVDCGQYAQCNHSTARCECPPGWTGDECLTPQCDSLADEPHRQPRAPGETCQCKAGWGGINCNVCNDDQACVGFSLLSQPSPNDSESEDMVCYNGGDFVSRNRHMCNITNEMLMGIMNGRQPHATLSCDKSSSECSFRFWAEEVESFYCALDGCSFFSSSDPETDRTFAYVCDRMKCKCIPGRFFCGELGSVDISSFLDEDIKGPGSFACATGAGCRFEEPSLNALSDALFGDPYLMLRCESGECIRSSSAPMDLK